MAWKLPHTRYLEDLIRRNEALHREEIAMLNDLHEKRVATLAMVLEETKKAHASEIDRAINENKRLKDEVEKLHVLLTPAIQSVNLEPDNSPPPAPSGPQRPASWAGFLRQAREMQEEQDRIAKNLVKPVTVTAPPSEAPKEN